MTYVCHARESGVALMRSVGAGHQTFKIAAVLSDKRSSGCLCHAQPMLSCLSGVAFAICRAPYATRGLRTARPTMALTAMKIAEPCFSICEVCAEHCWWTSALASCRVLQHQLLRHI